MLPFLSIIILFIILFKQNYQWIINRIILFYV